MAIAAAGCLGDGINSGTGPVNYGEGNIYTRFNDPGGNKNNIFFLLQLLFDGFNDSLPVDGEHSGGKVQDMGGCLGGKGVKQGLGFLGGVDNE